MDDTNNQIPNNENQNDTNQYQDILNQYTNNMNSEPQNNQQIEEVDPEPKKENPLLIKTDMPIAISDNIDVDDNENNTTQPAEITPEPAVPNENPTSPSVETTPVSNEESPIPPRPENFSEPTPAEPEKTPEEIKKEIDALLNESNDSKDEMDNQLPPTKSSGTGFFKVLFFISLLIFLGVSGILAYSILNNSKKDNSSTNKNNIINNVTPTIMNTSGINCVLNEMVLKVGDTFAASDNCNTCVCNSDGTIGCTEEKCLVVTPSLSPTATTSTAKKVTPTLK